MKRSYLMIAVWCLVAFGTHAFSQKEPHILQAGEYYENAIHQKNFSGFSGNWFAVCPGDSVDGLLQVEVTIEAAESAGGVTRQRVAATVCKESIFMVRNIAGLSSGALVSGAVKLASDSLWQGSFDRFDINIRKLPFGSNGFRLLMKTKYMSQSLYTTEWVEEGGGWQVEWFGDLNRDNIPDLLIRTSHKYSSYQLRLFLSGDHGPQTLLKEVAMNYVAVGL